MASWGQKVQPDEQVQRLWAGGAGRAWGRRAPGPGELGQSALRSHSHTTCPHPAAPSVSGEPPPFPREAPGPKQVKVTLVPQKYSSDSAPPPPTPLIRAVLSSSRGECLRSNSAIGDRLQIAGLPMTGSGNAEGEGDLLRWLRTQLGQGGPSAQPGRCRAGAGGGFLRPPRKDGGRPGSPGSRSTEHENEQ